MFTSLRSKIIGLCTIVSVTAMLGQASANYLAASRHQQQVVQDELTGAAKTNAALLAAWVRNKSRASALLEDAVDMADPSVLLKAGVVAGNNANTFIGYPDKRHVFYKTDGIGANYDPTTRPWYTAAVKAGKAVVTDPYISASGDTKGKPVVTFAEPIYANGVLKAVIGTNTSLARVTQDVSAIKLSANSYAFLVNEAGLVIAHPDAALVMKPSSEISPALDSATLRGLAAGSKILETPLKGREAYLRGVPVEGSNWILVIAFDKADANAGLYAMLKSSAGLAAGALLLTVLAVGFAVSRALRRLQQVRDAMQDVASGNGDLTIRLAADGKDELAQIAGAYNQFADKLTHILKGIRTASESVKVGAAEIAKGNVELSARTEQQAGALEETAASMEELTSTVKQTADNARQSNQLVQASAQSAQKGGAIMTQVVGTMSDISASSGRISEITGVIDGIAFQTNILALNAAVEAARAGEAGRGFAVVAAEVRTLAQRSAQAAKEIKGLIADAHDKVSHGVQLVQLAGATMGEIVESVKRVTDIGAEIGAATHEQSQGIGQVNSTVSQLDAVTQQNAALVEEAAAAASSLEQQADELAAAVAQFRLDAPAGQRG
jgi:methyl-accepting chemotaxis protein